jgi:prolipoprotein diacylglyceryl transferase
MLASIPSPSFNSIEIGPFSLNMYGLMIALGVVAAVWLFGRRLEERQVGTRDDASSIAIWAVLAGVIGARLYHVATDWDLFADDLGRIPQIWKGGLGIPGGLLLGVPVGLYMAKRRGLPLAVAATCAAPAVPLAQAIGRWGNYFNQELYGRPTDLPWALEIDAQHIDTTIYAVGTTFHPTFLYESLWSLGLCLLLLWIDKRFRPAPGQLFVMYIIGYGIGRYWVEGLRVDRADEMLGLRWNQWVSIMAIVGGAVVLAWMRRHPIAEPVIAAPADAAIESSDDVEPSDDVESSEHVESDDDSPSIGDHEPSDELEPSDDVERSGGEPSA